VSGELGEGGRSRGGSHWLRSMRPQRRAEVVRLLVVAALVAGAVLLVVSLSGSGHHSQSAAPPSEGPIKPAASQAGTSAVAEALRHGQLNVVVDEPSSDPFAEQNRLIAQGAQVAAEELDAGPGLPGHVHVNLIAQNLDGLSASALHARLRADASGILILPCDTDSQVSLAAAAARSGTLMLAGCNDEPTAGQRYPTYWPVGSAASEELEELTRFMASQGYLRAFVVGAPGTRYVQLLTDDFKRAAQSARIRIVGSASIDMGTHDFSGLAQTIKGTEPKPSVVFTALPPPLVNRLAAGLQAQGVGATVFGTSVMDSRFTLRSGEAGLENAILGSYGFPREGAAAQRFAGNYAKQFGAAPVGSFPGLGYETIRLLGEAARQARSAQPSAIQQALARGLTLHGVALASRRYLPGSNHNPVSEVGVEKIVGRGFEPLLAGSPSGTPPPA
jgi:ABC-type branched-subunit amino acid transport system substrate-binding protein